MNGITIDTAPVGYTYREVIGYIASLAGGFACVDRTGTIVIKWYEDNGYTINESRIMTFEKNESDYHLDYFTCNVDSNTSFTAGSGTLGITFDNPLMTEEKLNSVYKKVRGFAYRGASLKTLGDIRLDPWDIVTVKESGETYKVPVMNITQEYDGGLAMTITAYGKTETETETDYKGPSTKLAERTYAEMMLTKELVSKKVDAEWVKANTVTAETIVSVNNELQNIKNNYLKSNEADIKFATIEEEKVIKSDIEQLNVKYEKVGILDGDVAGIKTLMFGSSTGESITTDFANSVISMIGTAQIKDSMIDSLDAKKIKALDIDTTDVAVHSKDGLSRWSDNTIQISDSKRVRVQIGKDTSGDYNMYVWDVKGNLMFDALGLTEQGVQREIIRNDMVKENANISAGKLDIASLFSVINNDGTHTLKSNKIYLDDAAQTLNVLLQDIKTGSGKDYSEWGSLLKQSDDFITQKLWWTENIDGTSVKEKFSNVNQTLQEYSVSLSNLAKYDDEIYLISYVPTKDNYPAWDWCVPVYPSDTQFPREETWQYNDTEWDKYIGKVAYWESEGRAWRFIRNTDGSHGWKEIPNSETAYMLKQNSALRINLDSISSSLLLTQQDLKDNYSTTMQMNNAITQSVSKESNSIKLEVSNNYATKKNLESYATTDSLESYATTASLTAFIKNENGQLRSAIEAIADTINITARGGLNISGDRFTLASTNTTITADGTITCKKLNAKGSTIGGYAINDYTLVGAQVGISSKSGYGWAFWAGSDTPDKAPFRVGHTGEIHATNADIEGTIKSNNATITGGSIKIDTSNSGENIILLNCSSSSLGLAPDGMSVTNGSATTIIGAENIMCNQGDGSISCKKMIVSNNAEIYGSCYTYDYYYIWSEGGWMELSQWIRQKLGI